MTPRKPASTVTRLHPSIKLFVLDTNVLMHDPTCLFRFQEHDIYIPMATLEELDANKKGVSEVSRNARQASRFLDEIVSPAENDIEQGITHRTCSRFTDQIQGFAFVGNLLMLKHHR
ncbi:MAG: hypothetical protein EBT83_16560 [Betaproteobacteria bacterium]|nr:hypothetical protein [Betaproteobacteria bacterium]